MMDINELKRLAGIQVGQGVYPPDQIDHGQTKNITHTASEKAEYMKKHNVRPGTDEWFRLWFARPYLTGEKPYGKK
jgi:hypothetical protein